MEHWYENKPFKKSDKPGYIIFKENKLVFFYINGLKCTPSQMILDGDNSEVINAAHGLGPFYRWTGNKNIYRATFMVPVIIIAYNLFMNSVDVLDQRIVYSEVKRKEQRVTMTIFIF